MENLPLPNRIWWPWDQPVERVGFEARFHTEQACSGTVYVSASGPYLAWLDETPLAIPELPYPSWRVMHAIQVDLSQGDHRLAIQAIPGQYGQPFLLACLDWQESGHVRRLASNSTWQMTANPPEQWIAQSKSLAWRPAWAFDGIWGEPWGMPCNAPQDFCRLNHGWQEMKSIALVKVIQTYQGQTLLGASVRLVDGNCIEFHPPHPFPANPPRLENTRPRSEWYRTREAHSQINNNFLDLFETRAAHVIFDAGSETFGRLVVKVAEGGPAIIAVTTGESLPEVQRYHRRVTDIFTLKDGESFVTTPTGFRYIKITALSCNGNAMVIEPIELQQITYPVEATGNFSSSDPALDEIWRLSAKTVHLCMQTEIWDGIKRDQLPWMGDLYTEALAIYHCFGDFRLARHSLQIQAEIGPTPDRPLELRHSAGLHAIWKAPEGTPYGPQSGDINGIPSYTLWWLIALADYVRYSGDTSLVADLAEELEATLQHVSKWVDADGLWRLKGGWDFIDWAPVPAPERAVYCHLLAYRAILQASQLLPLAQRDNRFYLDLAQKMKEAARQKWWLNGQGSFGVSHHVNAAAISCGILTSAEAASLFDQTLASDPPLSMTYWHRFLDLNAAAATGQVRWGLDYIRRYWGQALQIGMTTLWEAFDSAWEGDDPHGVSMVGAEYARYGGYETSLCHGWSAGPAIWLHTAILGVQPIRAGFLQASFNPCLGDLDWAKGVIPTPHGKIQVSIKRGKDGKNFAEIKKPDEIALIIPDAIQSTWEIKLVS